MPKTTKRTATKHAARIAKAHATELPIQDAKTPRQVRRPSGYKPPSRGIARYPWATAIMILLILLGIGALYFNHVGPFATPAKAAPKTQTQTKKPAAPSSPSPCLAQNVLKQITNTSADPSKAKFAAINHTYKSPPAMTIDTQKTYCAGINTNRGLIVLELDPKLAPHTVNNFVFLAQHHFYDGMLFHRVIQTGNDLHIIQTGDPLGNDPAKAGTGGPGYKFLDEPVKGAYTIGTVAMANSGLNSNGSQFFISTSDNSALPKQYNLFGHVVQGLEVAQKIQGPNEHDKNVKPDTMTYVVVVPAS